MRKIVLAAIVLAVTTHEAGAIVLNQTDDFQDGTTMGWGGGAILTNVPGGGPGGAGDRYLEVKTSGAPSGPGSRLGAIGGGQWTGDYVTAGVAAIEADLRNSSGVPVEMRLFLSGGGGDFTSTTAISVPDDGQWHHVRFDVGPADLTAVGGTDVALTLASVSLFLPRHQPGPPAGVGGAPALPSGVLGADNLKAVGPVQVPALSDWGLIGVALLLFASATLIIAGRRRRSSPAAA